MRRHRKLIGFSVLAITAVIATQQAFAADGDPQPTSPTGVGDLIPTPDLTNGDTRTLFEQFGPNAYSIDFDHSLKEAFRGAFNGIASLLMNYIVSVVRGAISVGWWLFSFTDIKPVTEATSSAIGATSTALASWLLPSAIAFGAIVAYVQRRSQGSAFGQLVWVLAAGLLAVSFAVSPGMWLHGIDGTRQIGAQAVMGASNQALGGTMKTPIAMPEPAFNGSPRDTLLRKSADSTWRSFAVMPWCIAEFGSLEACERYGKGMLEKGSDDEARRAYIDGPVAKAEGGSDAPTVQWTLGKNPFGRIGVLTLGAIAATLFAFLNIALAFTALMAFIGCLLLMVVGVFFVCLWIVPGRPRQWGMNWFEALLGLVLQSVLAMLVFGTALTLVTAVFSLIGTLGWLPVTGLAIVVLFAAYRLRRLLEGLTTMMRPGMASVVMGSMARRGATSMVNRLVTSLRARSAAPEVRAGSGAGRRHATLAETSPNSARARYRQLPKAGQSPVSIFVGSDGYQRDRPALGSSPATSGSGPSIGPSANGKRTATGDRFLSRPKQQIVVSNGSAAALAAGTSRGESDKTTRTTSRGDRVRRKASPAAGFDRGLRYEAHDHGHTASLRDGPPKIARTHRRPVPRTSSVAPRPFREYSRIVKQGVARRVPASR